VRKLGYPRATRAYQIVRRFQPDSFSANRCPPGPKSRTVRAMNNRRAYPFSEAAPSCRARRIPSVRTMTTQHVATPQYFHPSPDDDRLLPSILTQAHTRTRDQLNFGSPLVNVDAQVLAIPRYQGSQIDVMGSHSVSFVSEHRCFVRRCYPNALTGKRSRALWIPLLAG
jgi:hypothetical protein